MILSIKVAHVNVRVDWMTPAERLAGDDPMGMFLPLARRILLNPTLVPEEAARTLMHEIVHAIYAIYELPQDMDQESVCTALDLPLTTLLLDNPGLPDVIRRACNKELLRSPLDRSMEDE